MRRAGIAASLAARERTAGGARGARGAREPARGRAPGGLAGREWWDAYAAGWERWEPILMHSLGAVDPALFRALDLRSGQRVLDLGCGSGEPAIAIAGRIGPAGRVLGVDISSAMLGIARRRARILGLRNIRFRRGDMARLRLRGPRFHRAVSRYGLMFAADPVDALGRVRERLVPRGILAASAWGPLEKNPGQRLRIEAARPFLAAPPADPEECADPMRFGRPGRLAALFRRAGFRRVRAAAAPVCGVYPSVEDYIRVVRDTSLAETYRTLSRIDRNRLDQRLRSRFRRFEAGACLRVPGLAWVVSGRR